MSPAHPSENDEWLISRIETWIEIYKKAMVTPAILRLVSIHQPLSIAALLDHLTTSTNWQITERGLYRTVKRLQDSGFLLSEDVDAPRTGAKRKNLTLTPLGAAFLAGIDTNLIDLPKRNTH